MHKHTAAEHDELMQYLREQHGMNYIPNVSWLLKDEEHHVILKNDPNLHEKLGLPDYIRVVKEGDVLHEQIDPTKYQPRFAAHTQQVVMPKVVVPKVVVPKVVVPKVVVPKVVVPKVVVPKVVVPRKAFVVSDHAQS